MNVEKLLELRADAIAEAEGALRLVESLDEVGRRICPTWNLRVAGKSDVATERRGDVGEENKKGGIPPSRVIPAQRSKRLDLGVPLVEKKEKRQGTAAVQDAGATNGDAKVIQMPKRVSGPEAKGTGMSGFVATWCERNGVGSEVNTTMLRTVLKAEFPDKGWDQIRTALSNGLHRGVKDGLLEKLGDGRYRVKGGKAEGDSPQRTQRGEEAPMSEKEKAWRELRAGMKTGPAASEE